MFDNKDEKFLQITSKLNSKEIEDEARKMISRHSRTETDESGLSVFDESVHVANITTTSLHAIKMGVA